MADRKNERRLSLTQSLNGSALGKNLATNVTGAVPSAGATLKRKVGLFSATAVVIGSIIGSGIFVSPSLVFRNAGSVGVSLLMWFGAGIIAINFALCMSELGALLPTSGGEYAYMCAAGDTLGRPGDYVVFMVAWNRVLLGDPLGAALQALTFACYALRLVYDVCEAPYGVTVLVAAAFSILATLLNGISLKMSTKLQNVLFVTKVLMLLSFIGTGIAVAATGKNHLRGPLMNNDFTSKGLTQAFLAALMTMDGGYSLCYIGEEIKNPSKNIPRALIIGVVTVMALFILTNVAYFVVLEPAAIAASDTTALTFAVESWGTAGAVIIPLLAAISTFGTLSAGYFSHSRLGFAAARKGHLPRAMSMVSIKSSVPIISLLVRGFLGTVFTALGSVEAVVNSIMLLVTASGVLTILALLRLRFTMKDAARPIKVPYLIVFLTLAVYFAIVALNILQAADYSILIVLSTVISSGSVAYIILRVRHSTIPGTPHVVMFLQKLFLCEPCLHDGVEVKVSQATARGKGM